MSRPAPADHEADPGVQADAHRGGVLAWQREEQAAAAHLRHRLGDQGGARGAPAPARGGRAARPPQARPRPRPVQLPRRDRLRAGRLPSQGRRDQAGDGGLRPPAPHRGGLRVRRHAAHLQGRAVPHLRAPAVLRRRHVPADGDGGRGLLPQGDELPDAQPDLQVARAVLPRAAVAAVRVRRVYRNEKSGVVHGLTRVRGMTQDDSHSYVTPEQAPGEIKHLLDFCLGLFRDFGLDDYYLELSTRDDSKPDKFVGHRRGVGDATAVLETRGHRLRPRAGARPRRCGVLRARRSPCRPATRSAAPGRCRRSSTTSTSREGFELEYQAADGTRQQPVMIHSAKFGSIERFIGVLVEHYAGAFPPWLAPCRCRASRSPSGTTTTSPRSRSGCAPPGLRVEIDDSDDRMQKKIRNAQLQKVPFMVIAGDQRRRGGRGLLPLPRRRPGQRGAGRRGDRSAWLDAVAQRVAGVNDPGRDGSSSGSRASTGSGPRTGWRTSHRDRRRPRGLPVLRDAGHARRGDLVVARERPCSRCSTCTRTTPVT